MPSVIALPDSRSMRYKRSSIETALKRSRMHKRRLTLLREMKRKTEESAAQEARVAVLQRELLQHESDFARLQEAEAAKPKAQEVKRKRETALRSKLEKDKAVLKEKTEEKIASVRDKCNKKQQEAFNKLVKLCEDEEVLIKKERDTLAKRLARVEALTAAKLATIKPTATKAMQAKKRKVMAAKKNVTDAAAALSTIQKELSYLHGAYHVSCEAITHAELEDERLFTEVES